MYKEAQSLAARYIPGQRIAGAIQGARAILSSAFGSSRRSATDAKPQVSMPDRLLEQATLIADPILNVGVMRGKGLEKSAHRAMAQLLSAHVPAEPASKASTSLVQAAAREVVDAADDLDELHAELSESAKEAVERLNSLGDAVPLTEAPLRDALSRKAHEVEFALLRLRGVADSVSALRTTAQQLAGTGFESGDVPGGTPKAEALRAAYETLHDKASKRLERQFNELAVRRTDLFNRLIAGATGGNSALQEARALSADMTRLLEDLVKDTKSLHFPGWAQIAPGSAGPTRLKSLSNEIESLGDHITKQKRQLEESAAGGIGQAISPGPSGAEIR